MADVLDWHVAVYAMNEAGRLAGCLDSVTASLAGSRALISVILNGSTDNSIDIARQAKAAGAPLEIIRIAAADKANAINQFYHNVRRPALAYGEVDGYAHIGPGTFPAMLRRLQNDPHAMAVSGAAINGRTMRLATAETLSRGGKMHGQLHAFRPDFLDRMVARGIKLPVGLYWGDGLLGSMTAYNLNPVRGGWDNTRLPGIAEATYEIPELSPYSVADLKRQFRREIRQMRGRIENLAIQSIIYTAGYEALPANSFDMVNTYLATHAPPKTTAIKRPFQIMAIRQASQATPPDAASLLAHRVN